MFAECKSKIFGGGKKNKKHIEQLLNDGSLLMVHSVKGAEEYFTVHSIFLAFHSNLLFYLDRLNNFATYLNYFPYHLAELSVETDASSV